MINFVTEVYSDYGVPVHMQHIFSIYLAWQYELNVMEEEYNSKRPDLGAIEEYKRKEAVYLERVSELDEITKKKEEQRRRHDNLR